MLNLLWQLGIFSNQQRRNIKLGVFFAILDLVALWVVLTLISIIGYWFPEFARFTILGFGMLWAFVSALVIWNYGGLVVDTLIAARITNAKIGHVFTNAVQIFFWIILGITVVITIFPIYLWPTVYLFLWVAIAGMVLSGSLAGMPLNWRPYWRAYRVLVVLAVLALFSSLVVLHTDFEDSGMARYVRTWWSYQDLQSEKAAIRLEDKGDLEAIEATKANFDHDAREHAAVFKAHQVTGAGSSLVSDGQTYWLPAGEVVMVDVADYNLNQLTIPGSEVVVPVILSDYWGMSAAERSRLTPEQETVYRNQFRAHARTGTVPIRSLSKPLENWGNYWPAPPARPAQLQTTPTTTQPTERKLVTLKVMNTRRVAVRLRWVDSAGYDDENDPAKVRLIHPYRHWEVKSYPTDKGRWEVWDKELKSVIKSFPDPRNDESINI